MYNNQLESALNTGNLRIVKRYRTSLQPDDAIQAAFNGHTHILKYMDTLMEIPPDAIVMAAKGGYIDTVKYLLDVVPEVPPDAIASAAESGHYDIVELLKDVAMDSGAVATAASTGDFDMVRHLVSMGAPVDRDALEGAIMSEDLDMVQYVVEELGIRPNKDNLKEAAASGVVDIVDYLIGYGVWPDPETILAVVMEGIQDERSVDVVDLLYRSGAEVTPDALIASIDSNNDAMTRYLMRKCKHRGPEVVEAAVTSMDAELVRELLNLGYLADDSATEIAIENEDDDTLEVLAQFGLHTP